MAEDIPAEVAAREKRVAGVFVFMLGAGLVIDRHALGAGVLAMLLGAAIFLWGLLLTRARPATQPAAAAPQPLERTP